LVIPTPSLTAVFALSDERITGTAKIPIFLDSAALLFKLFYLHLLCSHTKWNSRMVRL
jgi:hypothetical protein